VSETHSDCKKRSNKRSRQGATLVETAIVLSVFITLVLGMVDLGYGVFKQHVLSQAARQLARKAIVRGELAQRFNVWGPEEIDMTADVEHEVISSVSDKLVGWNLDEVNVNVSWPDGGNDPRNGDRIHVDISAPFRPTMTFILGNPSITLRGKSTMYVAH